MSIRRLQGWALVAAAAIGVIGLIGVVTGAGGDLFRVLNLIGGLLFIFGIPAILSVQAMGMPGAVGVALMEIGAILALIGNLSVLLSISGVSEVLPLVSAVAGALGAVIVGWLTTRERVFAAWIGWALIIQAVLNFVGGLVEIPGMGVALTVVTVLVTTAALVGYGMGIVRHAPGGEVTVPGAQRKRG